RGDAGADRRPEEREDQHRRSAGEMPGGLDQRIRSRRPGEGTRVEHGRWIEYVERAHDRSLGGIAERLLVPRNDAAGQVARRANPEGTMHPSMWSDMFSLSLPVLEKLLRPVVVYVFLVVGLRLAGKRELAQLNAFDLVVLLTLSNTVQNAIIGDDNTVTGGILGAATLLAVNYGVVRFLWEHEDLDRL